MIIVLQLQYGFFCLGQLSCKPQHMSWEGERDWRPLVIMKMFSSFVSSLVNTSLPGTSKWLFTSWFFSTSLSTFLFYTLYNSIFSTSICLYVKLIYYITFFLLQGFIIVILLFAMCKRASVALWPPSKRDN